MDTVFTPSDFVAVLNQTLEYAYPTVVIVGELANLRIIRNRLVYFDLKDEYSSVRFFGYTTNLPGPLEDGMMLEVVGRPSLHQQYGFSINFRFIKPVGKGSIRKAAKLLSAKLEKEGLFDPARKRAIPYPPAHIGLIASAQSAAYADFIKIINARWCGLKISHIDVQVQGEAAVADISNAIERCSQLGDQPEVLVITRGGGSTDDLAAFNSEQITRAVAASRIPTVVAIGHEVDTSLAELAADRRASTPSNAAELLVPDKVSQARELQSTSSQMTRALRQSIDLAALQLSGYNQDLTTGLNQIITNAKTSLTNKQQLLNALDPQTALRRGYSIVRTGGKAVTSSKQLKLNTKVDIMFSEGQAEAVVDKVK